MKVKTLLLYMMIASAAVLTACATEEKATPLFYDTDLIELSVGTSTIAYTLPSGRCTYVVVGVFGNEPKVNAGTNQLDASTPILYGTRTNLPDFVVGAQSKAKLYSFDQGAGDFDISLGAVTVSGVTHVAVWAYDSNFNLIASSAVRTW